MGTALAMVAGVADASSEQHAGGSVRLVPEPVRSLRLLVGAQPATSPMACVAREGCVILRPRAVEREVRSAEVPP